MGFLRLDFLWHVHRYDVFPGHWIPSGFMLPGGPPDAYAENASRIKEPSMKVEVCDRNAFK